MILNSFWEWKNCVLWTEWNALVRSGYIPAMDSYGAPWNSLPLATMLSINRSLLNWRRHRKAWSWLRADPRSRLGGSKASVIHHGFLSSAILGIAAKILKYLLCFPKRTDTINGLVDRGGAIIQNMRGNPLRLLQASVLQLGAAEKVKWLPMDKL